MTQQSVVTQAVAELGVTRVRPSLQTPGYWQPALEVQFLPKCNHCGCPHPKTHRPKLSCEDRCPGCGSQVMEAPPSTVEAVLTTANASLGVKFGLLLLWVAKALFRLKEMLNGRG